MVPEAEAFTFEIHSKLITTQQLERRLRGLLPPGTFSVEMKHNIYYIHVDTRTEDARAEEPTPTTESLLDRPIQT
ncbi:hypothetical protein NW759_008335 [Fusarium solani]|jgi:hypothetical protein|nr:hypothetical protein NW759_008335 [Fusarium solani]